MPTPLPPSRPPIPALTSLRFFAALWVVLFHIREIHMWTGGPRPYLAFISLGYLGVSFFFVLSGFILVYVYGGRGIEKPRFWQARFARIYPAYVFSLLFSIPNLLHALPFARQFHLVPLTLIANPLLLEAWFPKIFFFWNPVAWSLSAEVFFYLVFPFAMSRLEKLQTRGISLWLAAAWAASLAITTTYVLLRPDGVAHTTSQDNMLFWLAVVKFNPLLRLPEFLMGMALGTAFLRLPARPRNWPIALASALLILGIVLRNYVPYPIMHTGLLAPVFALFIFGFATQPSWARFFSAKPLVLLGEASYSLYLLHATVIVYIVFGLHMGDSRHALALAFAFLVAINLFAIAVYHFVENPLRRLLRPHTRVPALSDVAPVLST